MTEMADQVGFDGIGRAMTEMADQVGFYGNRSGMTRKGRA